MTVKIIIPENIAAVMSMLESSGFEAYIVGGCVRDSILNIAPHDFDVTTDATPEEMLTVFDGMHIIETGLKHGTVTVISGGEQIEITTFRIDGEYSDSRRPDSVTFTRLLREDLSRRDFTINAMAYSENTGLVDYFGGIDDILRETIRCVGEPEKRFSEDALRIMRAVRFSSVLGFEIEPKTRKSVLDLKDSLKKISSERISSELEKLIMGNNCYSVLTEYAEVLAEFIPEITACVGFDQHNRYHRYTVWEHICMSVATAAPDKDVRLAMLFHDIAKPLCYSFDEEKKQGHFYGHEQLSAEMAEKILRRLKMSGETIHTVCTLIGKHYFKPKIDENGMPDRKQIKKLLSELDGELFFKLLDVQRADANSKQGFCLERLPVLDRMEKTAREILAEGDCLTLKDLAVNGNDLMELGLEGRSIGEALDMLLDKVVNDELPNDKETLLGYLTK